MLTPEITSGVKEFLLSCQTFEGGFGSCPHTEAHGGYTFCSIAGLSILGSLHECDVNSLEVGCKYIESLFYMLYIEMAICSTV